MTGEFPAERANNTENVSIWWRHHVLVGEGNMTTHRKSYNFAFNIQDNIKLHVHTLYSLETKPCFANVFLAHAYCMDTSFYTIWLIYTLSELCLLILHRVFIECLYAGGIWGLCSVTMECVLCGILHKHLQSLRMSIPKPYYITLMSHTLSTYPDHFASIKRELSNPYNHRICLRAVSICIPTWMNKQINTFKSQYTCGVTNV